ncbi:MAG: mechanosensitive ion channel family protein [Thermoanaerobaculia bacterium]|nr:mechanosensitive ion channel family protein [Thermoanaerobaculia bacterium]MCZ7652214.1 mechanosensitive ion channel family protein [Thermoanaerobaculia bacterium]
MTRRRLPPPFVLLLAALAAAAPLAAAGEPPAPVLSDGDTRVESAPVVVDGAVLFRVRGFSSFPAAERAAGVAERIRRLAGDSAFDPATLRIVETEVDTRLVAGEERILLVSDDDAELEGVRREQVAEARLHLIRRAIAGYRAARSPDALLASAWRAGAATLAAALLFAGVVRGARLLGRRFQRRYRERIQSVTIQSFELLRAERLWHLLRSALALARTLALLLVGYLYLRYLLTLLPWTRGLGHRLDEWALAPLGALGRGLVQKIPDLLFLLVLYFLARWTLQLLRLFFGAVGRGEVQLEGFDPDWADPTYKLVRVAVVAFALVVAYPYIPGSSSAAFKGVSLFLGVVFSLGSTSAISNVVAGYTMTYRRAFRVGDRVKIAGLVGDVTNVRLQVTHLRTPKNEEVVVPNSQILASEVVNYSTLAKDQGLILHTTVGIGYETPWRQVEAMLLEAARRTPGLLAAPAPFVFQTGLGDFCITYEINAYCDQPQRMGPLYSALHANILDVFNEHGVQIMTPAYEGDPEQPKVVPRDQWHLAPAAQP